MIGEIMSANNSPTIPLITSNTPLRPAVQAWEMYLKDQGKSHYTIKAFVGDLMLLSSYLPPDKSLGSVTTADLNHFLDWLIHGRGIPCSPKSFARRITSIKSFFRWLSKYGAVIADPAEKVVQKSVISPLPEVLTPDEEQKVIETAIQQRTAVKNPDARPYTLVSLLLSTAIKKGECLSIKQNHIDLEASGGPVLFVRYTNPSYRYKERKIALSSDWVEAYQEYLVQYQPADQVFPWSSRRLEYLLEDLGKAAGLSKHLSFDMCRWTGALDDWRSNMDRDAIRQKLGISKVQWREINLKLRRLAGETIEEQKEEPAQV